MSLTSPLEEFLKGPTGDASDSGPGACILLQAIPSPPSGPSDPVVVAAMWELQQLLLLYLPPPLLNSGLLGQGTSTLPGSRFLQENVGTKGWQDPTCRPPARKSFLSTPSQGCLAPLGRGMRRTLLILFGSRLTEFTQPSLQELGQSADAAFPPSRPRFIR